MQSNILEQDQLFLNVQARFCIVIDLGLGYLTVCMYLKWFEYGQTFFEQADGWGKNGFLGNLYLEDLFFLLLNQKSY